MKLQWSTDIFLFVYLPNIRCGVKLRVNCLDRILDFHLYVRKNNYWGNFSLNFLHLMCWQYIRKIEDKHREEDGIVDSEVKNIIISVSSSGINDSREFWLFLKTYGEWHDWWSRSERERQTVNVRKLSRCTLYEG
jgi:hypothetical protein